MDDTSGPVRLVFDEIVLSKYWFRFIPINNWLIFWITRLNIEQNWNRIHLNLPYQVPICSIEFDINKLLDRKFLISYNNNESEINYNSLTIN